MTSEEKLIVFLKAPRPGLVKTRLARQLGDEAACSAYVELVETLLGNLSSLTQVDLRFAPDDAGPEISQWLRPGWESSPQGSGDLGQRLVSAFHYGFSQGAKRVAVIGSDCPSVTVHDIQVVWESLHAHDVVLGPANDGGYWLVGLSRNQPALFEEIPWSQPQVLTATLDRVARAGLKVKLLRPLSDIDTNADWVSYRAERRGVPRP